MKIFIWGMGLMGASLALRLRHEGYEIAGAVRSEKSKKFLEGQGFTVFTDHETILKVLRNYDVLVLGLNIDQCIEALEAIFENDSLKSNLVIFDMCSTKKKILDFVDSRSQNVAFIGAHPMAGKEQQGPEVADSLLYEDATVYLTLARETNTQRERALSTALELWQRVGAKTVVVDAERHDNLMAYVSHGLHLVSCLIAKLSGDAPLAGLAISPAAGSYRDMTRVVESSGNMWKTIIESNSKPVSAWLLELADNAKRLAQEIEMNSADIPALFESALKARNRVMQK